MNLFKNKYSLTIHLIVIVITIGMDSIQAKWWLLSQYNLSSGGIHVICDHIPGLERLQKQYCHKFPEIMQSIGDGIRLGVDECQHQFQYNRWNCSTNTRDITLFGKHLLKIMSRETAFIYAITSAGVVHSITQSCRRGLADCACDPIRIEGRRGRDTFGHFSWGGCSQNVRFATVFARKFIDSQEINFKDANSLMILHNNRVGRKIVSKNTRLVCKCHGVSGSCLVRTCWRVINDFRLIGDYLKQKYSDAKHVDIYQTSNRVRQIRDLKWKAPKTDDLIFFDSSPDYCHVNKQQGFYGTEGRICNKTSLGPDSCDLICCGRGYQTQRLSIRYSCRCRFYWCCRVICQECVKSQLVYTCRK